MVSQGAVVDDPNIETRLAIEDQKRNEYAPIVPTEESPLQAPRPESKADQRGHKNDEECIDSQVDTSRRRRMRKYLTHGLGPS